MIVNPSKKDNVNGKINNGVGGKYVNKYNQKDFQFKLNNDELANASYMVNHTNSNNTTINNNTLNNMALHSQGLEKQVNSRNVPKGFFQDTYHKERIIHHQRMLNQLRKHLGLKQQHISQKQHFDSKSNKVDLVQRYLNQQGPTI